MRVAENGLDPRRASPHPLSPPLRLMADYRSPGLAAERAFPGDLTGSEGVRPEPDSCRGRIDPMCCVVISSGNRPHVLCRDKQRQASPLRHSVGEQGPITARLTLHLPISARLTRQTDNPRIGLSLEACR